MGVDLSLERIEAARDRIDPAFLDTPQFVDERLSAELGCEVVVKIETLNPIGSFKGRGTWLVAEQLDAVAQTQVRSPSSSSATSHVPRPLKLPIG